MKTRTKIAIGVPLVFLGVTVIFVALLLSGSFQQTKHLRMGDVEVTEYAYYAGFFEGNQTANTASVYIRISEPGTEGHRRMLIEICHEKNTELDTLSLTFNSVQPAEALAYHAPDSASWPPVEYHVTSRGAIEYVVPGFGFMGVGTVNMQFTLDTSILNPLPADGLRLDIEFTMHKERWVGAAKQVGQGTISLKGFDAPG